MNLADLIDAYRALRAARATMAVGANRAAVDDALARIRALALMLCPDATVLSTNHTQAEVDAVLELGAVGFRAYCAERKGKVWDGAGGQ